MRWRVLNANGTLTTYTWDGENRLATIATGAGVITLGYDATGLRRKRQDSGGTTDYLWDGESLLMELSGGTTQAQYTLNLGSYGDLISQRRGGTSRWFHFDALGSTDRLTDSAGAATDSYIYRAFGPLAASTGSTTNPHRYIGGLGYYAEPDLGLSYVRARWLRPATGAWLSVDPVEGQMKYGYMGGRAMWAVDPGGLGPWNWSCIWKGP